MHRDSFLPFKTRIGGSLVWRGKLLLPVKACLGIKGLRNCWSVAKGELQGKLWMPMAHLEAARLQCGGPGELPRDWGNWAEFASVQKIVELAGSTGLSAKDTMNTGRERRGFFVLSALLALKFFCWKFKLLVLVIIMHVCVLLFALLCCAFAVTCPQIKSLYNVSGKLFRSTCVILKLWLTPGALHNSCPSLSGLGHTCGDFF